MKAHLHEAALGKWLVDGQKSGDAACILLHKTRCGEEPRCQGLYFEFHTLSLSGLQPVAM
jgi:hypothetical protein